MGTITDGGMINHMRRLAKIMDGRIIGGLTDKVSGPKKILTQVPTGPEDGGMGKKW